MDGMQEFNTTAGTFNPMSFASGGKGVANGQYYPGGSGSNIYSGGSSSGKGGGDAVTATPSWYGEESPTTSAPSTVTSQAGNPDNVMNQSAQAYKDALAAARANVGATGAGIGATGGAVDAFGRMVGYNPEDIQAGLLSSTNLTPYMNPFQQNVIDATMTELNRQEGIGDNNVRDSFAAAGSFGGDREAIYRSDNRRNFRDQRQSLLSALNSQNFLNAQSQATNDLNRKLTADQSNQSMRSNMLSGGASGLAGVGSNLMGYGQNAADMLGSLSQMGFGFGNEINRNNLLAGSMKQQQIQQLIDAAKAQVGAYTGGPQSGLERLLSSLVNPGGGTVKSSTDPGALGTIGNIAQIAGAFM